MLLVSLDIDGTMEFGEPPGPVTVDIVRMLLAAGIVVGSASDRTRSDQEETWAEHDVVVAFVGGKHQLDAVRARFPEHRCVHVGDTHVDEHYAGLHGFEFVGVDDPDAFLRFLRSVPETHLFGCVSGADNLAAERTQTPARIDPTGRRISETHQ